MRSEIGGRRALVTGAAGFIASGLVRRLLDRGAEVHALVRPGARLDRIGGAADRIVVHQVDLRNRDAVERALRASQASVVFHLAATGGHPRTAAEQIAMLEDTVLGTANLLAAAAVVAPAQLVHVASSLEYGRLGRPAREDDALRPTTFRGAAKAAATMLALEYALEAGRPATILRLFSVYGPREQPSRLTPTAVRAAYEGLEFPLAVGPRRDFVYVEDVVDALLLAATAELRPGEILNVGTGRATANEELVEALGRAIGTDVRVRPGVFDERPWDGDMCVADVSKSSELLGWEPAHTLEEGLRATYEWFRSERAVVV